MLLQLPVANQILFGTDISKCNPKSNTCSKCCDEDHTPTGFAYIGIFIAKYEITIAGIAIIINIPANNGNVEFSVIVVANVANPRTIEITANAVALVLLLCGNTSF